MEYPKLKAIACTRRTLDVFRGCNRSAGIGAGEFRQMENLTSDHYPQLAPRRVRSFYRRPASPQGIIAKDTVFRPNDQVTREEMAKIITLAYAMVKNEEISVSDTENFADHSSISDWAKEYVYYARKCGLLKGDENSNFRPDYNVTRDEAAVSAVRLKNLIK